MSVIILPACILYNICLCHEDDVADFLDDGNSLEVNNFEAVTEEDAYATKKRDGIKRYINMHC